MKRVALIGHRGVGKSSLLSRIARSRPSALVFDLDQEIATHAGRSVSEIFHSDGEPRFRELELEALTRIESSLGQRDVIVALGAGFPVAQLSDQWHAVWVRRATDESGRIFTDRPRLDAHVSALDEFKARAAARTPAFAARADAVLILDEGPADPTELAFICGEISNVGGALTILPENFARDFEKWIATRVGWGFDLFELRDDLLSQEQIAQALALIPRERVLFSRREAAKAVGAQVRTDWPLELGAPSLAPAILSLHERGDSVEATLERLTGAARGGEILKAALPIANFDELMIGHRWREQDPLRRAFLPMSRDGRWAWYRLLTKQPLNFVRESAGSASDQPTLLQWLRNTPQTNFAAVLGDPVKHSRTPMEQREFFGARGMNTYAIRITEDEWSSAIAALEQLGLRAAAVTAPLKHKAFELTKHAEIDETTRALGAVNTIAINGKHWLGTNTDLTGLRRAMALHPVEGHVCVWGGGGTLDVLKRVLPHAEFVSARTNRLRDSDRHATPPDVLVYVGGPRAVTEPLHSWKPHTVFDLNYGEASPGRDYAVKIGATYISGLAMFEAQAQAQRKFWETLV